MIQNKMELLHDNEVDICTYCGVHHKILSMITIRIGYRDTILAYSCYPCWNSMSHNYERFSYKFSPESEDKE